jgi:hypothetical protein
MAWRMVLRSMMSAMHRLREVPDQPGAVHLPEFVFRLQRRDLP